MQKIEFPIVEFDNHTFQIKASLGIYNKEAVVATCYKYSGKYFVHQELNNDSIVVTLQSKDEQSVSEKTAKQFCNELIDQQIRYNTNLQFGHIRDLIVEEAFKPVNTK